MPIFKPEHPAAEFQRVLMNYLMRVQDRDRTILWAMSQVSFFMANFSTEKSEDYEKQLESIQVEDQAGLDMQITALADQKHTFVEHPDDVVDWMIDSAMFWRTWQGEEGSYSHPQTGVLWSDLPPPFA